MDPDNDDDLKQPLIPAGDVGTLVVAAVFLIGFLYLMFGPSPFEGMFKDKPAPQQQAPAGEVMVTIPPKN
jgi:hypothetical protein